jgi:hypothetical protein
MFFLSLFNKISLYYCQVLGHINISPLQSSMYIVQVWKGIHCKTGIKLGSRGTEFFNGLFAHILHTSFFQRHNTATIIKYIVFKEVWKYLMNVYFITQFNESGRFHTFHTTNNKKIIFKF